MPTNTTLSLSSSLVFFAWLTAACGDTGTPVDNTGIPTGDAANGSDSRGAGSGNSGSSSGSAGSGMASSGIGSSGGAGSGGSSGSGRSADDAGPLSSDAGVVPASPDAASLDANSDAVSLDASSDTGARMDASARGDAGARMDAGGIIRWSTDVQPLLDSNCTNACHGGCGNLVISYSMIVNVKTGEIPRLNYITPRDPGHSYLWCKVNPTDVDCTRAGTTILPQPMPLGGPPLSAQSLAIIKAWIVQGALNN